MITGGTEMRATVNVKWQPSNISRLTYDLEVTLPGSHGIGVHLTHVPTSIRFLHFPNVQIPTAVIVVRQHNARILCDDVVVDAENRLRVHAHPRDLRTHGNSIDVVELHSNEIMS
jgi:hypothetical protein